MLGESPFFRAALIMFAVGAVLLGIAMQGFPFEVLLPGRLVIGYIMQGHRFWWGLAVVLTIISDIRREACPQKFRVLFVVALIPVWLFWEAVLLFMRAL